MSVAGRWANAVPHTPKAGYDFLKVFLVNYISLLEEQVVLGNLSRNVCDTEKSRVLLNFALDYIVNIWIGDYLNLDIKNLHRTIRLYCKGDIILLFRFYFILLLKTFYGILRRTFSTRTF